MTQKTTRSRVLRRVGAAVAAAIAVSTVASSTSQAASRPAAIKRGGSVTVGIFDTLPQQGWCTDGNAANSMLMAWRTIYETLFEKNTKGDAVGLLAEKATPSADLKTWTIKLRKGIKFTDGTAFDAEAVKANLDNAGHNTTYASTAMTFIANIATTDVVDTYTVKVNLDRPQNDLPLTMYASGRFFIRSPKMFASKNTCLSKPIGTGPFMVKSDYSFDGNLKADLVVQKNPGYWRKDPVTKAKLPYLDKITFKYIQEATLRSIALRSGQVDAAMFSAAGEAKFIQDLRAKKKQVTEYKSPSEYYPSIWFNQTLKDSPFKEKACREAVSYALNRAKYVKERTRGEGTVADSLVGPSSVMYNKKGFITYNLTKAKAKAQECATALGTSKFEFSMPSDTSTVSLANATEIKNQMAAADITMNILQKPTSEIISNAFGSKKIGGAQNAYQALPILLLEGTDVSFNMPFLVSNTFAKESKNPLPGLFKTILGTLLNLNHHTDTKVDEYFFGGEAAKSKAAAAKLYKAGTQYLQENAFMTAIQRFYYTMFTNKKLGGIGKLQIVKGQTQRVVTNWGIDWTGVYLKG